MLLIIMLQKLTEMTKRLGTTRTIVRIVRDTIMVASIGEHGCPIQIWAHGRLLLGIPVDLIPGVVSPATSTAIPAFDVLDSVGSRLESNIATNRASYIARTMNLHVHVQLVLARERAIASATFVIRVSRDTIPASTVAVALVPLVATEAAVRQPLLALGALSSHVAQFFRYRGEA